MTMHKYYFTFGTRHKLRNYVQLIVAFDLKAAMKKMFELYGENWAMDYSSEEYNREILSGSMERKKELETVVV